MEDRMLTVQDVAERLQVNANTVRRWLLAGKLAGVRLGGSKTGWRIAESDLREFVEQAKKAS